MSPGNLKLSLLREVRLVDPHWPQSDFVYDGAKTEASAPEVLVLNLKPPKPKQLIFTLYTLNPKP